MTQGLALAALLVIFGLAIAGPSGLLAWADNTQLLNERKAQIVLLEEERAELENSVALLNHDAADPDLVGELLRKNLNVVHEDEIVITHDQ